MLAQAVSALCLAPVALTEEPKAWRLTREISRRSSLLCFEGITLGAPAFLPFLDRYAGSIGAKL